MLFADALETGLLVAIGVFITALSAAAVKFYRPILDWLLNRKKIDFEHQQAEKKAAFEQRKEEERTAHAALWDLYNELKNELAQCREDHRMSDRRNSRLEAVIIAHGWVLPPLGDGSDKHSPLHQGEGHE